MRIAVQQNFGQSESVMFYTPIKVVYLWTSDKIFSFRNRITAPFQRRK